MTTKPCTDCNGSGWTEKIWSIHCYTCKGTGTIPNELGHNETWADREPIPDLCEVCRGTGVDGYEGDPDSDLPGNWNDLPCTACDGTGSSDPSIQQTERHMQSVERGEFSPAEGLAIDYDDEVDPQSWLLVDEHCEEDHVVCPTCLNAEEYNVGCPTCGGSGYV